MWKWPLKVEILSSSHWGRTLRNYGLRISTGYIGSGRNWVTRMVSEVSWHCDVVSAALRRLDEELHSDNLAEVLRTVREGLQQDARLITTPVVNRD
jgi:hypothetical protein